MTRKTWSTVDVSAYLDNELAPDAQVAFEAAVSQDPDLQHRVAEMSQVVTLMRSVPLQEPPRNYLLTQAMVGEPKRRPQQRRFPLLMMRIATSAAAAAFAITTGLTLMQREISPQMMTQSREAPAAAILMEKDAAGDEMEMLEAPMAMAVPVEEPAEGDAPTAPEIEMVEEAEREIALEAAVAPEEPPQPTPSVQGTPNMEELDVGDVEAAATPLLGTGVGGETPPPGLGIGGGGEAPLPEMDEGDESAEPEAAVDSAAAPVEVSDAADIVTDDAEVSDTIDTPPSDTWQAEAEMAPVETTATKAVAEQEEALQAEELRTQQDQALDMDGEAIETPEIAPSNTNATPAVWTPIGLGILTAALAGITFWMSRRQPN